MTNKLTATYLSTLCLEFYMLLNAGITIHHGVEIMLEDEPDKDAKKVLQALSDALDGGNTLATALTETALFPSYMTQMVAVGEQTGRLADTLQALSAHYERQDRLAMAIKSATVYPAILFVMMIAVVMILIVQVLPIFNDVLGRMGAQMSPLAAQLLGFGAWFRGASVVIAVVALVVFVVLAVAWVVPAIREQLATVFRQNFAHKGIFGRVAALRFMSSLSLAISSGLNIEDSIELASTLTNDSPMLASKSEQCRSLLNEGNNLADALRQSGILSVRDGRLLALGDQSGMTDNTMAEIVRRSDTSVQDEIARLVGRIEPTLVIFTSVVVGIILLSVMLPLIGIMTSIG